MPSLGGADTAATGSAAGASSQDANPELENCEAPIGTMAVDENQGSEWFQVLTSRFDLPSTVPLLRTMIQQSNCFVIVERGTAFNNIMQERQLAESGETRSGSNMGKGQMVAADYTMRPSINFSKKGTGAAGGLVGGLFGGVVGAVAAGLKRNEASTTLLLIDNRSSVQLSASQGSAKNYDIGGGLLGFVGGGGYTDTPEGKLLAAAFMDSFNQLVSIGRRDCK